MTLNYPQSAENVLFLGWPYLHLNKIESGLDMSKNSFKMYENLALLSQVALMMITPILGGVLIGRYLDDKVGTNGIFLLIFVLIGTATAFMELFKLALRKTNDHPPKKRK
mgnify:CR=1 FL=1